MQTDAIFQRVSDIVQKLLYRHNQVAAMNLMLHGVDIRANSPEAVILVELLRGIADNGLLADLHAGSWHKEVIIQNIANVAAPEVRDKLRSCLKVSPRERTRPL
jgi:hypothetical protein